jgi:GTP cyclohydrolase I
MTANDVSTDPLTAHERGAAAVAVLLESLGYDPESERLRDTPARVATSLAALLERPPLPAPTYLPAVDYDGPVVIRDIPFQSLCEHHLLPFRGRVALGYRPRDRVVGISALVRLVDHVSHDLQMQERMTSEIADWIERELAPAGLGVLIDAEHLCMSMRDVGTPDTRVTTNIVRGEFSLADLA